MQFSIVHETQYNSCGCGRLRVRSTGGFSKRRAQGIAACLAEVADLEDVRINARTGSVRLVYTNASARALALAALGQSAKAPLSGCALLPVPAHSNANPGFGPLLRYTLLRPLLPMGLRILTAIQAALPYLRSGITALRRGRLNVDVLDASAIFISLLRRDYRTVSLLTLLLGLGEALEYWTRQSSRASLARSLSLDIDTVWVRRQGQEMRVPLDSLAADDLVLVRSGSAIAVDGVVVVGEAVVNQASMTGEAQGVVRLPGSSVFAGTVVEEGEIAIRPTGTGDETRLQKIVDFIEQSQNLKARVESRAMRLADMAVPFTFLLAGLVWLVTRNPARAATVLLVDYSCALRLATPLAILTAVREGASHGVLIKGGVFLEALAEADTVVFDKTGTLTVALPQVVEVVAAPGREPEDVLRLAACLEEHFPHPVARAVVRKAEEKKLNHKEEHTEVEYVVAHGVATRLHSKRVLLGSHHYIHNDENVSVHTMASEITRLTDRGLSVLYLAIDNELAGLIGIEDSLRAEAPQVIQELRRSGIERIVMLTGDDERTARAMARKLNITEWRAQVLPVDKAEIIRELQDQGRCVIMIGDGINDAPALSAANVGISLRDGADLAREVADVVLTESHLGALLEARKLARGTMKRIHQNFQYNMGFNSLFLGAGLIGVVPPGMAAMLHNTTTVGVTFNAMRSVLPALHNKENRHA